VATLCGFVAHYTKPGLYGTVMASFVAPEPYCLCFAYSDVVAHTCRKRTCLLPVLSCEKLELRFKKGFRLLRAVAVEENFWLQGSQWTTGSAGHFRKRCVTGRPTVAQYLKELPD